MKQNFFSALLLTTILACNNSNSSDVQNFIPGSYENKINNVISPTMKVEGTAVVEIKKTAESGSESYTITRTANVIRTHDNIQDPGKEEKQTWSGFYDTKNGVLTTQSGKVLSFDIKNNQLIIDGVAYKKLR